MSTMYSEYPEKTPPDFADHLQEIIDFIEDMREVMGRRDSETVDTETVIDTLITLDSELALYNEEVTGG